MSVPLPTLFANSLSNASKASRASTIQDSTQELIQSSLTDLITLSSRITGLSLFSPNETLEDISTKDLIYLLVPYVLAEVRGHIKTVGREGRISVLRQTQKDMNNFLSYLEDYEIIPDEERALHQRKSFTITDAVKRRELKIKQFQKEKELKMRIEETRKRKGKPYSLSDGTPSDLDLILSILPTTSPSKKPLDEDDDDLDSETEEVLRETILLLLRLFYAQAHSHFESMDQELELLLSAPPSPRHSTSQQYDNEREKSENDMWRLDIPGPNLDLGGKGPLLDQAGKPLRPFTILPSDRTDRARLQAQVFGPGHRLPTMSIDEYLQIERERGNIITGGGPASEAAPTSSEQLAFEAEMDGTIDGEVKADMKRLKDENWARFTDENPKGAGNTMNRG